MANASVNAGTSREQHTAPPHSRRTILGRLASAATIVALPAAALAAQPDPHPAWAREAEALIARGAVDRELSDEELDAIVDPLNRLENLIATTPAGTLAGAREQLVLVRRSLEHNEYDRMERAALANAQATLERLAGSAAHV